MQTRIQILLVEDNPLASTFVTRILESESSFQISQADSLASAIRAIKENPVDVILLDLFLPDSGGLSTLYSVYTSDRSIPIVILSSLDDEEICIEAVKKGAQDYLIKGSFDKRLLTRSIHYAIERKKTEEARRASEERYALAAKGTNDGIWDWDLKKNEFYVSERWLSMLNLKEPVQSADKWISLVHPQDSEKLKQAIHDHIHGSDRPLKVEYRVLGSGEYKWMLCRGESIRDDAGIATRISGSQTDITEYRLKDTLTGLPDRRLFEDRLGLTLLKYRNGEQAGFTVLYVDIDRFNRINETFGIPAGDEVLQKLADRMKSVVSITDTVSRIASDEFIILAENISESKSRSELMPAISEIFRQPCSVLEHEVFISASIGVVHSSTIDEKDSPDSIIAHARSASAKAKKDPLSIIYYRPGEGSGSLQNSIAMESRLRRSIENAELKLYFQPQLNLHTGKPDCAEALIRWEHPSIGLVRPDHFLPLAEESGLMGDISEWTLRTALMQAKKWSDEGMNIRVAVNLSPTQFRMRNIAEIIKSLVSEIGADPGLLEVEFTETVAMSDAERTIKALQNIKEIGAKISVDDFGTGFSSLTYLKRFPISTVKIDKEFVMNIPAERDSVAIVTAILAMSQSLGLEVVAEGVETSGQLEFLKERGCDFIQGYFFAKPMPAEEATHFLRTHCMMS